jgi:anti-sigma regulatory factor (Ser/Thr protein kinase)
MTSARTFNSLPDSVPAARRFARDVLRGQSGDLVDAAELMVSELATNCVQHAQTDFEITIRAREQVRIEVRDTYHGQPQVQSPPPQAPSGRGLRIVQEISDEWGIIPSSSGKTVWFALNLRPAGSTGSSDESKQHTSTGEASDEQSHPAKQRRLAGRPKASNRAGREPKGLNLIVAV